MSETRINVAGLAIDIYQRGNGCLVVKPQCLADVTKLGKGDIFVDTPDINVIQLLVPVCDITLLRPELKKCINHLVTTCNNVPEFHIVQNNVNNDGSDLSMVFHHPPPLHYHGKTFLVNNVRQLNGHMLRIKRLWLPLTLKPWVVTVAAMVMTWNIASTIDNKQDILPVFAMFAVWTIYGQRERMEWLWWQWILTLLVAASMGQVGHGLHLKHLVIVVIGGIVCTNWPRQWGRPQIWLMGAVVGIAAGTCHRCWCKLLYWLVGSCIPAIALYGLQFITNHSSGWSVTAPGLVMGVWLFVNYCTTQLMQDYTRLWTWGLVNDVIFSKVTASWHVTRVVLIVAELSYCFTEDYWWIWFTLMNVVTAADVAGFRYTSCGVMVIAHVWYTGHSVSSLQLPPLLYYTLQTYRSVYAMLHLLLRWLEEHPGWQAPGGWFNADWLRMKHLLFLLMYLSSCNACWLRWLILPVALFIEDMYDHYYPGVDAVFDLYVSSGDYILL